MRITDRQECMFQIEHAINGLADAEIYQAENYIYGLAETEGVYTLLGRLNDKQLLKVIALLDELGAEWNDKEDFLEEEDSNE